MVILYETRHRVPQVSLTNVEKEIIRTQLTRTSELHHTFTDFAKQPVKVYDHIEIPKRRNSWEVRSAHFNQRPKLREQTTRLGLNLGLFSGYGI